MAQRAPSRPERTLWALLVLMALEAGCRAVAAEAPTATRVVSVDVSAIPATTLSATDPRLVLTNGVYLLDGRAYDGAIEERYPDGTVKSVGSFLGGMRHGLTETFYAGGQPRDSRSYRANLSYGRHVGYWDDGRMKFDFFYLDDKREGVQQQWYRSGAPYTSLTFRDDEEDGMQRAWRENGRPFINYEARDGFRYGLQKAALCYTLEQGALR